MIGGSNFCGLVALPWPEGNPIDLFQGDVVDLLRCATKPDGVRLSFSMDVAENGADIFSRFSHKFCEIADLLASESAIGWEIGEQRVDVGRRRDDT